MTNKSNKIRRIYHSKPNKRIRSKISEVPNEKKTAINEYLDIVRSEYDNERRKKESFENRAYIVMSLVGALCVFVLEKITLGDILSLFTISMTFSVFLKIITGIFVYTSIIVAIIYFFRILATRKHDNFEVKNIDESLMSIDRMDSLAKLIKTYRDIILQHRDLNEARAKWFKKSLIFSFSSIIAISLYYLFDNFV